MNILLFEGTNLTWKMGIDESGQLAVVAGGGTVICTVHERDMPTEAGHNTALIAASPELLSALFLSTRHLKRCHELLVSQIGDQAAEVIIKQAEENRRIIRKALGHE